MRDWQTLADRQRHAIPAPYNEPPPDPDEDDPGDPDLIYVWEIEVRVSGLVTLEVLARSEAEAWLATDDGIGIAEGYGQKVIDNQTDVEVREVRRRRVAIPAGQLPLPC